MGRFNLFLILYLNEGMEVTHIEFVIDKTGRLEATR